MPKLALAVLLMLEYHCSSGQCGDAARQNRTTSSSASRSIARMPYNVSSVWLLEGLRSVMGRLCLRTTQADLQGCILLDERRQSIPMNSDDPAVLDLSEYANASQATPSTRHCVDFRAPISPQVVARVEHPDPSRGVKKGRRWQWNNGVAASVLFRVAFVRDNECRAVEGQNKGDSEMSNRCLGRMFG
ncbi:hypothetical protein BDY21DRAFT_365415 [Lineolata rhizophorae]|uniref:Secreted protein n=1 Tax=Lineolata rhizophorae TaxID=578093 RepID=A0A6A6NVU8_9PEZI|nr:hypothetical protein BDY21DRAFT_365415 [Lineolata rhizophorae]